MVAHVVMLMLEVHRKRKKSFYTYIDTSILHSDTKVALVLCVGRTIKYKMKYSINITDSLIQKYLYPWISISFLPRVALVLKEGYIV